jgi:formylglycine-generating enzyme required for sulfatase activity
VTDRVSLVVRGGSFLSTARRARHVRSAYRSLNQPDNRNVYDGFRVARTYR